MKTATAMMDGVRTRIAISVSLRSQRATRRVVGRGVARSLSRPFKLLADTGVLAVLSELLLGRRHVLLGRERVHRVDVVGGPTLFRREAVDEARNNRILRPLLHPPLLVRVVLALIGIGPGRNGALQRVEGILTFLRAADPEPD